MTQKQLKKTKNKLFEEIFSEGYYKRARVRASQRKSPWNLILIPLSILGIGSVSYFLFQLMWWVHVLIYPIHKDQLSEFWQSGISFSSFISSFLLTIPVFIAAIPLGLMITNCIARCIPQARRTFDQESRGHKLTSFSESMYGLYKISIILVPICLILSLIGALTLRDLR